MLEQANKFKTGLDVLCDPDLLTLADAIGLAHACIRIEPNLQFSLAERLTDTARADGSDFRIFKRILSLFTAVSSRRYRVTVCSSLRASGSALVRRTINN